MIYTASIRNLFIVITALVLGTISITKIGIIDAHAIIATAFIVVPAAIVMGFLGQKIGEIVDNPKNRADADYKISVLNALKKMDKSITLQELNEKLTKTVAEPDSQEPNSDDDLDV
jgi:carbonic anhydrase/acetyltransferase-like protein (isoleucine patch superfamily)